MQGDFDAHRRRLEELGAEVVLVKKPEQLDEIDGLVIPGGESGTFLKLLGEAGFEKLKQFVRVKPTFGTCAGAILLANEVENPKQAGLGALDIAIRRNAYGRQLESSIRQGHLTTEPKASRPSKWSSFAPPRSSGSDQQSKCSLPKVTIPWSSNRERPWRQRFIPNCRPTPASTAPSWT